MKTKPCYEEIHSRSSLSRLRIIAAGTLFLAAAALAATSMKPPKLPWAVPTVTLGNNPAGTAVDQATHTIYVANSGDNTISVIDGSRCNAKNASRCSSIATLTAGPNPLWVAFDQTTSTIYVTIGGGNNNTIAVINGKTCNAKSTSGCGQTPATVTTPNVMADLSNGSFSIIVLDTTTRTLYVGDADDGLVSIVNTATCNGTNTSGCGQTPVTTAVHGDSFAIDHTNHSVYVDDSTDQFISVLNGATCNSTNQSGCGQTAATVAFAPLIPLQPGVDETTHTLYVPLLPPNGVNTLGYVALIDGSTCNSTVTSGCGKTPPMLKVGFNPEFVMVDPTTETAYVLSLSNSISVINAATCNAKNQSGCLQPLPALAVGVFPFFNLDIDLSNHTIYVTSDDTNTLWVLNTATCNASKTSGCTMFEPTTTVGAAPVAVAANPNTKTVYVANQEDNTVSIIDTTVCNEDNLAGCNHNWPTITVGDNPRFIGINKITNTIYVSNLNDNTLSVVNGATCNGKMTSGCIQRSTTPVGNVPQQVAVDEATNTIYVVNQGDGTVSVVNGVHCNGADVSDCSQSWPTVTVGASPQALGFNPDNRTIYVTNTNDNTVSVVNAVHCNRTDTTGCVPAATIPVGAGPRSVGIVLDKNTVFVGNRDDLTVSVIDGSTCNGTNTTGCSQTPPAVLVGAFPSTGGTNNNILGRSIVVDSAKHIIYITNFGDSDVATLDANTCRAGHVKDCHVKIVHKRVGGIPDVATVDESSGTVFVSNNDDGTVSLFPTRSPCDENHGDDHADDEGCD